MEPVFEFAKLPGWNLSFSADRQCWVLHAPSYRAAKDFVLAHGETVARSVSELWVRYSYYKRPFKLTSDMASNSEKTVTQYGSANTVFTGPTQWNPILYEALGRMLDSDLPMVLVAPDGYQLWANQKAADLFKDPPEVSVTIKGSDYCAPEDLAGFRQKLDSHSAGSTFEHTYRCQLTSDGQWARLTNRYEILEGGYRLATILSHEFIDKPEGVEIVGS